MHIEFEHHHMWSLFDSIGCKSFSALCPPLSTNKHPVSNNVVLVFIGMTSMGLVHLVVDIFGYFLCVCVFFFLSHRFRHRLIFLFISLIRAARHLCYSLCASGSYETENFGFYRFRNTQTHMWNPNRYRTYTIHVYKQAMQQIYLLICIANKGNYCILINFSRLKRQKSEHSTKICTCMTDGCHKNTHLKNIFILNYHNLFQFVLTHYFFFFKEALVLVLNSKVFLISFGLCSSSV